MANIFPAAGSGCFTSLEPLSRDFSTSVHSEEPDFIPDPPDSSFICVEHVTPRAQMGFGTEITVTLLIYALKQQMRADDFLTFRNQLRAIYYR